MKFMYVVIVGVGLVGLVMVFYFKCVGYCVILLECFVMVVFVGFGLIL